MTRPTPAFRLARRCYGHLAGEAGVLLRERLEAAGLIRQEDAAYRLTEAGRAWAHERGLDTDDRDVAKHARCCLDGTEKRLHVGGRLGKSILTWLLLSQLVRQGKGRVLLVDDLDRLLRELLPRKPD